LRSKIDLPLIDQSMISRAGRQGFSVRRAAAGRRCRLACVIGAQPTFAVAARLEDEALPRRRVAIVGGVELAPLGLEAEPPDRIDPGWKYSPLRDFTGLPVRTSTGPQPVNSQTFSMIMRLTRSSVSQVMMCQGSLRCWSTGRLAAARHAVVRAGRRGHQQVEIALGHQQVRPHRRDVLHVVPRLGWLRLCVSMAVGQWLTQTSSMSSPSRQAPARSRSTSRRRRTADRQRGIFGWRCAARHRRAAALPPRNSYGLAPMAISVAQGCQTVRTFIMPPLKIGTPARNCAGAEISNTQAP
jgi:hypothetical protein